MATMPHKQMSVWCGDSLCKIFPEIHRIKPGEYFDTLKTKTKSTWVKRVPFKKANPFRGRAETNILKYVSSGKY